MGRGSAPYLEFKHGALERDGHARCRFRMAGVGAKDVFAGASSGSAATSGVAVTDADRPTSGDIGPVASYNTIFKDIQCTCTRPGVQ